VKKKKRKPVVLHTHRDVRGELIRAGWCEWHDDFAWQFSDKSVMCLGARITEEGSWDCEECFIPGKLYLSRKPKVRIVKLVEQPKRRKK